MYNEFHFGVKMVGGLKEELELLRKQLTSSNETMEEKVSGYRKNYETDLEASKER